MEVRDYHLQIFHPHRNESSPHLRSRISDPSTHNSLPGECWKPSHMKSVLQMKEKLFHWTTLGPQSRGHFVHLSGQVDTGRSLCLGWSTFFGTKTDLEKWKHPKWWNLKLSFSFRLISTFCRILWFQAPQIFLKTIEKNIDGLEDWIRGLFSESSNKTARRGETKETSTDSSKKEKLSFEVSLFTGDA